MTLKERSNSTVLLDRVLDGLQPGSEVIDAGANAGDFTQKLAARGFHVFAFEPIPSLYENLRKRFDQNLKVSEQHYALSDKWDFIKVNVQSCWTLVPDGTAGLERAAEFKDSRPFHISCVALDDFCDEEMVAPAFIKMDVDGYEFKALRGARGCLMLCKPPIMLELNCYINKLGEDPKEFVQYLLDLGYVFWSMDGEVSMDSLEDIMAQWPYHSSYDVMLLPKGYEL